MPSVRWLLERAAALYDSDDGAELRTAAGKAWRGGFVAGGEWMRLAMGHLRGGTAPAGTPRFTALGWQKYRGAAACGAIAGAAGLAVGPVTAATGFVAGFYAFESLHVFLFPAALDGAADPWKRSRRMVHASGGWPEALRVVTVLATVMLTGGLLGRGFLRSWCLGCLAVVLWHEQALKWLDLPLTETEEAMPVLSVGNGGPLLLRREPTTVPCGRALWISDLHWTGRSDGAAGRLLGCVSALSPALVLLGGDYADSRAGLSVFGRFLTRLAQRHAVLGILGNHDRWIGKKAVEEAFAQAGATVSAQIGFRSQTIRLLHDPAEVESADDAAVFLAGHLHGCQITWRTSGSRQLPGAWLYRWNVRRGEWKGRPVLVSRGLGDTLPFRWRTPRELILLEGPSA